MIADEIDLLTLIHEINETLIHGIRLVALLASRNDVFDNEPEQELMKCCHIPFFH